MRFVKRGEAGRLFWRRFQKLARFKIREFELSWEAFWRRFRELSRFKIRDFEVSWEAFSRRFREL